ncbi:MAG: DUF2516 family protein [Micromonosporaceae bacterium]|nr:DUF2516 family protein [Micromonosporaceae bacterium]
MDEAVVFVWPIVTAIELTLLVVALTVEAVALVHCLLQRADAFSAVNTLSKGLWLALLGGTMALSLLFAPGPTRIFGLIAIIAALVYLLDVRPAIRDLSSGSSGW